MRTSWRDTTWRDTTLSFRSRRRSGNRLGGQWNQPSPELLRVRRLAPGDKLLICALLDYYRIGDLVFAYQTGNGIYVAKTGGMFIGWAAEDFCFGDDIVDLVDIYPNDRPYDLLNANCLSVGFPGILSKIRKLHRTLDRRKRFSCNWKKALTRPAKCHRALEDKSDHFQWTLCHLLLERYDVLVFEDLNLKGMAKWIDRKNP